MPSFKPNPLFRNPHVQTICASTGPRKFLVRRRARTLIEHANTYILDCGDGVRLQGEYSAAPNNQRGLVILIHGWLGCNDSLYLLSTGQHLFQAGYNVFRLNLRDHGETGHLNRELFNSTRIDEVVNAVKQIQLLFPQDKTFLCGFSLGGNFALRVAANAPQKAIQLNQVVAVCPVINPYKTNQQLNAGPVIYHRYFRNKWRRSLQQKLQHFPDYNYGTLLKKMKTLDDMNYYFVPNHTEYQHVADYLNGYGLGKDRLQALKVPCHIISSADDPVISAQDLNELPQQHSNLVIELTQYGGHCGYINGFSLSSWIDQRIHDIIIASS